MTTTNYNNIAFIYDILAKLVFGRKLELAKSLYLSHIPEKAKVLVVGGGTGLILNQLENLNKQLKIDFVDQSAQMIARAKKHQNKTIKINYHECSILNIDNLDYDVILTNFFFDQFSLTNAQRILYHLKSKLRPNGMLIFSDFIQSDHIIDKIISRAMFSFFRITVNLRTRTFLNYNNLFSAAGFQVINTTKVSTNIVSSTYAPLLVE